MSGLQTIAHAFHDTLKTTYSPKALLLLLLGIVAFANELAAQERSIVFLPEHALPVSAGVSHRAPRIIGKPKYSPPPVRVQSHNDERSEFPNYNVTNFLLADQDEPFVAINPLDVNNVVAGANDYRSDPVLWSYTSLDGGKTWLNQALPKQSALAIATDPSLAFDRSGVVYFANGGFETTGIPYAPNQVNVFKSSDKGQNWSAPTHPFQDLTNGGASVLSDKYFIAVDQNATSPFKDRIYVAWAEAQDLKTRIVVSYSVNGGTSWSPRTNATSLADLTAPVPMTAPNGDLFVTYIDKSDAKQIMVVRSHDGGQTFATPVKVANYRDLGPVVPEGDINKKPYIKDFIAVNSFPSIAIDHSAKYTGRIYISWAARDAANMPHIYVSISNDNGQTWSAPTAAEDHTSPLITDRFFNWIAVDKRNGDVGVIYYDSRLDSIDNRLVDVFFSHSRDGGATYTSRRVTTESIDPHIGNAGRRIGDVDFKFFGDYIGLAVLDSNWQPVWTDTRPGNDQEIFTARLRPYVPHGVEHLTVVETGEEFPTLRWTYDPQTTLGYPLSEYQFRIRRDDGVETIHSGETREFIDETAEWSRRYTYTVTVLANGYESIGRDVRFFPITSRQPQSVTFITSKALSDGFTITMRIPDKNEINHDLEGLDSLFILIDGVLKETLAVTDIYKGTEQTRTLSAAPGQYHLVKATVSTNIEGFRTFADTAVVYLWSGEPAATYANDFEQSTNVFTPNAWSLTNVAPFTSNVINDSLPNVDYGAGVNAWFMLPPVKITPEHRTLEYDQIALVHPLDLALVEYSHNNGVSFEPGGQYTIESHAEWVAPLANSRLVHDRVYLQKLMDSSVIVRFRLIGSVGGMEGWFVDNINFTDALTVARADGYNSSLYPNPLRANAQAMLTRDLAQPGKVTITVVDVLGRTIAQRNVTTYTTKLELPITLEQPGSYTVLVDDGGGSEHHVVRHKLIVIP